MRPNKVNILAPAVFLWGLLKVRLTSGLGRQGEGLLVDGFVFDRGSPTEPARPATPVVCALDPVDDRLA